MQQHVRPLPIAPNAVRSATDVPDFKAYEAIALHRLPPKEHPWSHDRHLLADNGLQQGCHFLRNGAHDPRLPRDMREILWQAHQLAWQARELLQIAAAALEKRHGAERRAGAVGRG